MTPSTNDLLKYANLQMAAEALFQFNPDLPGGNAAPGTVAAYTDIAAGFLLAGNNRSSRFTATAATDFVANWSVVERKSDTTTGFSRT